MSELKLQQSRLDGRYDIQECLGRGSYAEIYVAHDRAAPPGAPATVVIKALNLLLQDTPDAELERTLIANFQNEAVALDRVRHPHIISRLGHGSAIDLAGTAFHYLVLEYLPGGDLAALSRQRPVPIDDALLYLEQVCSGLAYAHQCGVIHRDIKPQNLLLTADRKTVKIADFGVARFDATEGAITRVGTSIYSAPEHNPLVQTAQLEHEALASTRDTLTPAADIYSLAKTVYTLLAGEAPRRFAQHTITELPVAIGGYYWARPVLRVLQKATQTRREDRYQTVEEFWADLADAALPATQPLKTDSAEERRRPSRELSFDKDELTQAPPQPRFAVPVLQPVPPQQTMSVRRPPIVVPVKSMNETPVAPVGQSRRTASQIVADFPDQRLNGRRALPRHASSRARRFLVAAGLIVAFSGMLLATHRYVTSHWNPLAEVPRLSELFVVGREGVTTTDVNLRADASTTNPPIGIAEYGSRVKVLSTNNNWYEVQVIEHGRTKNDPFSSDRGWINKKFVRFD